MPALLVLYVRMKVEELPVWLEGKKRRLARSAGDVRRVYPRRSLLARNLAWAESSSIAAGSLCPTGGVEAGARTPQHLGDRSARGLLEIRRAPTPAR